MERWFSLYPEIPSITAKYYLSPDSWSPTAVSSALYQLTFMGIRIVHHRWVGAKC